MITRSQHPIAVRRPGRGLATVLAGPIALGAVLLVATAGPASAGPATGVLYLVDGLSGTAVTAEVDGTAVAAFDEVTGALMLPAGRHTVRFLSGSGPLASSTVTVAAGASSDVVVHRAVGAGAGAQVTVFGNDVSAAPAGQGRVVVAHVAAVGPADIRVDGRVVFADVANGEFSAMQVPAGRYSVDVLATGRTTGGILGPLPLDVSAARLTRVYAVGDTSDRSMNAVVHVLPLRAGGATPRRVDSGTGGQAAAAGLPGTSLADAGAGATDASPPRSLGALLAGAVVVGPLLALRRRRRCRAES